MGVTLDYAKALEMYLAVCGGMALCQDSSCVEDVGEACNNAGAIYLQGLGVRPDQEKAASYFRKGCELDNPLACRNAQRIR